MQTTTLQNFFTGEVSAVELAADLNRKVDGSEKSSGHLQILGELSEDFAVTPQHLISLCDAVLINNLDPALLEVIGSCLITSDRFTWGSGTPLGDLVAITVYNWSSPEVNYALNQDTVAKFRHRLLTGEETFTKVNHGDEAAAVGRVVWNTLSARPS
ncbi:MAG: hypothetical protein HC851_16355 [Acaryochloris sp. RU_4_1]|nr:hypothetical protein [Acaryochloris sp. RU_4_1]NJR56122.1 hypothetical protein [Acaryochloris sp. CRU_2_0]